MAQPTPYRPATVFSEEATISGDSLQAELVAIQTTLNEALVNLGRIQNDEGFIKQAAVLPSAFNQTSTLLALSNKFFPRGDWTLGFQYEPSDIVLNEGAIYICLVSHLSSDPDLGGTFAGALTAEFWMLLPMNGRGITETTLAVSEGDLTVTHSYTPEAVIVFLNGVKMQLGVDVTATSGTNLVFTDPLHEGDELEVIEFDNVVLNQVSTLPMLNFNTAQTLGAGATATFGAIKIRDPSAVGITLTIRAAFIGTQDGVSTSSDLQINVYRNTGAGAVALITGDGLVTGTLPWPSIRADKTDVVYATVSPLGDNDRITFEVENLTGGSLDVAASISFSLEDAS